MIGLLDNIAKNDRSPTTTSTVKNQSTTARTPARNIPAPSPPGLGLEYADLWNQTWALADWIDDVNGPDVEIRRARLPELEQMIQELSRLEKLGARPPRGGS